MTDMKTGDTVKVLTSAAFPNEPGKIEEMTNQGRVVVRFSDNRCGFYTLGENEFEVIESA